jgi:hypothetical protein
MSRQRTPERPPYDPMELPPDERATRPAQESRREVARGRASFTPFAILFSVAGVIAAVVAVVVAVAILLWIFL